MKIFKDVVQSPNAIFLNLTSLPSVVIFNILDHVDFPTLKTLRSVCHATKSWTNCPRYVKRFKMCIKSNQQSDELATAVHSPNLNPTPWPNIKFSGETTQGLHFFQNYNSYIVNLELKNMKSWAYVVKILKNLSPTLQSLTISLDNGVIWGDLAEGIFHCDEEDDRIRALQNLIKIQFKSTRSQLVELLNQKYLHRLRTTRALRQNLSGLKKFQILDGPFYYFCKRSNLVLQRIFDGFFKLCPNLTYIGLPNIDYDYTNYIYRNADFKFDDDYVEDNAGVLSTPLSRYIENEEGKVLDEQLQMTNLRQRRRRHIRTTTIDFGSMDLEHGSESGGDYNDRGTNPSTFPIIPNALIQLITNQLNCGNKLVLLNVPTCSLPPSEELTNEIKAGLDISVHSVMCATWSRYPQKPVYIPKHAKITLARLISLPTSELYSQIKSNITCVYVLVSKATEGGFTLGCDFFKVARPSVESLHLIDYDDDSSSDTSRKFVQIFPNLKRIEVRRHKFDRDDDVGFRVEKPWLSSGGLLDGLHKLEAVVLENCAIGTAEDDVPGELSKFKCLKSFKFPGCSFRK